MTAVRSAAAAALGLAAAYGVVSVWQMTGMDNGWRPGSPRGGSSPRWVAMMAAMMPPGAALAVA
jgi:hypothetical protein